ncbi:hypothetical protein C5Y96_10575 [Blastopirellula marina]|uniref:HTH cro/C1-type domain-containing protein n=1 Tax=Blastopirellula marina TaxID=124 RepID=A0A2S8FMD1_9BACT|nr:MULTISPECIES: P-loop NTPase fold protein [Pirellulaceae]PQO33287.1 hypothetical protein C5Y96_10575 [Blastopirellula marina]RCS52376.1 helix-turn-helix domain-containing protein [Bremerella cremea]
MSNDNTTELGRRIRALRESHNLSQKELAVKLGVHQRDISSLETSPFLGRTDILATLARHFNISIEELTGRTEQQDEVERPNPPPAGDPNAVSPRNTSPPAPAIEPDTSRQNPPKELSAGSPMFISGAGPGQSSPNSTRDSEDEENQDASRTDSVKVTPEPASGEMSASIGAIKFSAEGTVSPPKPGSITGHMLSVRREASDDSACLNIRGCAHALATFFASVEKDLFFAIFGPWGRGKSFLMRFVTAQLEDNGYSVISFSAWRFRKTPELWVYLYEVIRDRLGSENWLGGLGLRMRIGVMRHGYWQLVWLIVALGLAILPLGAIYLNYALTIFNAVGILGCVVLVNFYMGGASFLRALNSEYLALNKHDEKLGVQGLIGEEIVNVFRGWLPTDEEKKLFDSAFNKILIVSGVFSLIVLLPFVLVLVGVELNFALPQWQYFLPPFVIWCFAVSVLCWSIRAGISKTSKVMIVVDDLDRCDADDLLSIVESLKVVLDDPRLHERVQVVMLIEEEILKRAIVKKYEKLVQVDNNSPSSNSEIQRLAREHIEKLFLCYYRLPTLVPSNVGDLVDAFIKEGSEPDSSKYEGKSTREGVDVRSDQQKALDEQPKEPEGNLTFYILNPKNASVYNERDEQALRKILNHHFASGDCLNPSPRSIRCWLFKFQLARLLHRVQEEHDVKPEKLATALMEVYCGNPKALDNDGTMHSLKPIVEAVA